MINPQETFQSVAIFGSGFNPPTLGHLDLIRCLLQGHPQHFDLIRLIPTGCSTLKQPQDYASREDRLQMLALLLKEFSAIDRKKIAIDTLEMDNPVPSRMVETLRELVRRHQGCEKYTLVCGYDHLLLMPQWFHWQELKTVCTVTFFPRETMDITDHRYLKSLEVLLAAGLEIQIIFNDAQQKQVFPYKEFKNLTLTVDATVKIRSSSGEVIRKHYQHSRSKPEGISNAVHEYILQHHCYA